jgi:hypothetical protein
LIRESFRAFRRSSQSSERSISNFCGGAVAMVSKHENFTGDVTATQTLWLWFWTRKGIFSADSRRWNGNRECITGNTEMRIIAIKGMTGWRVLFSRGRVHTPFLWGDLRWGLKWSIGQLFVMSNEIRALVILRFTVTVMKIRTVALISDTFTRMILEWMGKSCSRVPSHGNWSLRDCRLNSTSLKSLRSPPADLKNRVLGFL